MTNQEIFEMADKLKAAKDRKKELDAQVKEETAEIEELDLHYPMQWQRQS